MISDKITYFHQNLKKLSCPEFKALYNEQDPSLGTDSRKSGFVPDQQQVFQVTQSTLSSSALFRAFPSRNLVEIQLVELAKSR